MTERAFIWYITQLSLMIICGSWFCVEQKAKTFSNAKFLPFFKWSEQKCDEKANQKQNFKKDEIVFFFNFLKKIDSENLL